MQNYSLKLKIIKYIFSLFPVLLLLPSLVFAAPSVSYVSGTVTDGSPIIISGSGLGTNSAVSANSIEWLGGASGNIEQGTDGSVFSRTNWTPNISNVTYSTAKSHSGTKSIRGTFTETDIAAPMFYDTGGTISKIYVTWWVYFDLRGVASGQWKIWRIRPDSSGSDTNGEIIQASYYNSDGTHIQELILYYCVTVDYDQCYPGSNGGLRWMVNDDSIDPGAWMRLELYAEASSDAGVRDGTVVYNIHKQNSVVRNIKNDIGTVITRATGVTNQWRWWQFQNYWGNLESTNTIVANTSLINSVPISIIGNPYSPKHLMIKVSDPTNGITTGKVTVIGADAAENPLNEDVDFTVRATKMTSNTFATITSITPSNFATLSGDETIEVGMVDDKAQRKYTKIYIDDPYIQVGTQARVEICDNAAWVSRAHCEIQHPTAWADGSITAIVNRGSFTNSQQVYLYIVDANGNVNASGYPITIDSGSTPDTVPPSAPTGLTVN